MNRQARLANVALETGVVTDLTHEAEGVVRGTEGAKIVFVAGALPGERISFRRVSFHRSHDEAELVEVLEPSTHRVTPRCAHFGVCGGCALQHLDPGVQLQAKQKELAANLERIGNVVPDQWLPPLLGPVWGYRRRARLSSRYVAKKGRSLVGFREKQGKYVADVARCEVLAEPVAALIGELGQLLTGMQRRESIPQIEVALSDGEQVLVLRVLDALPPGDVAALRDFEQAHRLRILLQPGGLDSVEPLTPGPVDLHYRLEDFDLRLDFGPTDFVQVNARHQCRHGGARHRTTGGLPAGSGAGPVLRSGQLHPAAGTARGAGSWGRGGCRAHRAGAGQCPGQWHRQRHFPRGRPGGGP